MQTEKRKHIIFKENSLHCYETKDCVYNYITCRFFTLATKENFRLEMTSFGVAMTPSHLACWLDMRCESCLGTHQTPGRGY